MTTPDYSFDGLQERANAALAAHREYVADLEAKYKERESLRFSLDIPTLAILGVGRAGKDTAGEFLSEKFLPSKPRSSSLNALPLVAHMIGLPADEAYAERHEHREFWIEACNALRKDDLTRLARWCLGACDVAIGLRGKDEFAAVMKNGVCDLSVWIERDVPADPTVEFRREDCDVVIENTTTLERFHQRLTNFGKIVYRNW